MTKRRSRVIQILALLLVPAAVAAVRLISLNVPEDAEPAVPIPVRVEYPQARRLEETLTVRGNLKSSNQVTILPKVAGTVTGLFADTGDAVGEGDILAQIDPEAYEFELRRAEAVYRNAASTWERVDRLYASGNATRQTWEDARTAHTAAEAQAAAARLRYDWTQVKSPASGVVLARHVNQGSLVAPDALTPLFTVGSLENLEVELRLPEKYYPLFSGTSPAAAASAESFPELNLAAEVRSVAPWVDPETGTFTVVCRVLPDVNTRGILRPGMLLTVHFVIASYEGLYTLPVSALTGGRSVWAVTGGGRAESRILNRPENISGYIEVPESWAGGPFVVEGQHFLQEGSPVRILEGAVP
jgi:multidrug efflux system membrane fusion protein